jgi:hypothetical protein
VDGLDIAAVEGGEAIVVLRHAAGGELWAARLARDAGPFGPPVRVDAAGRAQAPVVALSARGDATLIWHEARADARGVQVMVARSRAGGPWSAPERLDQGGPSGAVWTDVAANARGDVAVVVARDAAPFGAAHELHAALAPAGRPFGPPHRLDTGPLAALASPQAAVGASGEVVVVFEAHDGQTTDVYAARYLPARATWTGPARLGAGGGDWAGAPQVVLDAAGRAVAAWSQRAAADWRWSVFASGDAGSGFGPARRLSPADEHGQLGALRADPRGGALVAWIHGSGPFGVTVRRVDPSGAAGAPQRIAPGTDRHAAGVDLAFAADGRALATWEQWPWVSGPAALWGSRLE